MPLFPPYVPVILPPDEEDWTEDGDSSVESSAASVTESSTETESSGSTWGQQKQVEYRTVLDFDESGRLVQTIKHKIRTYVPRPQEGNKYGLTDPEHIKQLDDIDQTRTQFVPYPGAPPKEWRTLTDCKAENPDFLKIRFKPKTLRKNPNHRWW